ncbi:C-type lectin domain family 6 member A-like isoform X2 [Meriones unguiculatus]|uniref:C-type lectin domain family 6 member A-like isoform X2 n=1 Tax=Meriones unguiculatus TaxID=10047 RepID=UPI00293E1253|nr:C-type lectin domain family 6 member A-like isoform X2 [Meriones unguiculatus]
MGTHLLVIHSPEEQNFITRILDPGDNYFIGLGDPGHRQWRWVDGTPYNEIATYILGNWTGEFHTMMEQLRVAIVTVNSTRVDPGLLTGLSSWIAAAMNHLKEWRSNLYSCLMRLKQKGGTVESCVMPHLKDGAGFRLPPSQWVRRLFKVPE